MSARTIDHASVLVDVPLAPLTTYKVGGSARWFIEPGDLEELRSVLLDTPEGLPITVLGRGSNVVISDSGFDGLVIRLGAQFAAIQVKPDGRIVAGGGTPLPRLARAAASAGRSGLGFYVGIPGSVGGAVQMNAGGHGSDTAAVLDSAVVVDALSGELSTRPASSLGLGYRASDLTPTDIVVQATFHTSEGNVDDLESELREITRWRKANQPGGTLNAGSVFKNPVDTSAGEVIDGLGLKGFSDGPVGVSTVHANFLVADATAKASDIHRFVHTIRSMVHEKTGRLLEPEIRFIGDFNEVEPA